MQLAIEPEIASIGWKDDGHAIVDGGNKGIRVGGDDGAGT